jgi:hypothetical protein
MLPMRNCFALFFLLALTLFVGPAFAADYVDTNWQNLTRALVRFNAIKLDDPLIMDDYALITECDLYNQWYKDEFKWSAVRKAIMDSVRNNIATFPMNFHYDVRIQLDRYDFSRKLFLISSNTALRNINALDMYSSSGPSCGFKEAKYLPHTFRAVLGTPLYLDGLPLSEAEGKAVVDKLAADHNTNRNIFARLNIKIIYIDALRKSTMRNGDMIVTRYDQTTDGPSQTVRLDARLDSIDFYTDNHLGNLIYEYIPEGN